MARLNPTSHCKKPTSSQRIQTAIPEAHTDDRDFPAILQYLMYTSTAIQTDASLLLAIPSRGDLYEKQHSDLIQLHCLARADDFQRKLPECFSLRQELLNSPTPANDPDSTASPLLALPYDILHLVLSTIAYAPSQIALLLTCKRLALLFPSYHLTLSATSPKYAGHLPSAVFDVPALLGVLTPDFPKHLRLCAHCLTARPCPPNDTDYWPHVAGCGSSSDFWIQKTGWEFHGGGWNKVVHDICPHCHGTCSLGDFGDCDGCSALGRLGDVNWQRLGEAWRRRRVEEELRLGRFAT